MKINTDKGATSVKRLNRARVERRMQLAFPLLAELAVGGPVGRDWLKVAKSWVADRPGSADVIWTEIDDLTHMGLGVDLQRSVLTLAIGFEPGPGLTPDDVLLCLTNLHSELMPLG